MKTHLCEKFGIDYPILQAPIGNVSCPELAAAVSNAGGLGSIAMTGWGYEGTKARLARAAELNKRGIVANLLLSFDIEAEFQAIIENPPKAVSFFWGDIAPYTERVHSCGALIIATVGSVVEAKRAVDQGADIIVAQGWEAGGHVRGQITTMALVPAIADAIEPIPVVAAGGIADGRGMAAALCLGAQAVWVGTRFLTAEEADIHPEYRARVLSATEADTYYSKLFDGGWPNAPGRVLRNETISDWENAGTPSAGNRPGEGDVIAVEADGTEIHRYDAISLRSSVIGDIGAGSLWAGQGVGAVSECQSAAEIVQGMMREAQKLLKQTYEEGKASGFT